MEFQKSFDELFSGILTDYRNQFPEADLSQGSLIFIKSACLASALWGLYKYQDWISKQIFPDTADVDKMEHHAWVRGITRTAGETDEEYLARLLEYIRRPPAGGNKYDYIKWAKEVDYVTSAWCVPLGQGLGTVDVIITADEDYTGSEVPSFHALTNTVSDLAENKLIDAAANFSGVARPGDMAVNDTLELEAEVTAVDSDTQLTLAADIFTVAGQTYTIKSLTVQVKEYIDDLRPVTAKLLRVLPPAVLPAAVTMAVTGAGVDKVKINTEITAYMNSMKPGQALYLARLSSIAISNGADNAVITEPAIDVVPTDYEMVRPGIITVS